MRRYFLPAFLIVFSFQSAVFAANSKKIDVFTADNIVQIVRDKITKTKSFTGSFIYVFNNKTSFGIIKYKSPSKFLMSYYGKNPNGTVGETGQKIVSDGKNLWLYLKDQNIAIEETLERDRRTPLIGWNINRLQKEYVPTLPKTGYQVQYGKDVAYKLTFVPKSNTAGFKSINMVISKAGDILKIDAQNQLNATVELAIKYESFNNAIPDENFEFEPDENTQIYENILLPKNQQTPDEND